MMKTAILSILPLLAVASEFKIKCGSRTYTEDRIQEAVTDLCKVEYDLRTYNGYPRAFRNKENFQLQGKEPYIEFPLLESGFYNRGDPGPDRIVVALGNNRCDIANIVMHPPGQDKYDKHDNRFEECIVEAMSGNLSPGSQEVRWKEGPERPPKGESSKEKSSTEDTSEEKSSKRKSSNKSSKEDSSEEKSSRKKGKSSSEASKGGRLKGRPST